MNNKTFENRYFAELKQIVKTNSNEMRELLAASRNEKQQARLEQLWEVSMLMLKQIHVGKHYA
jgi:prolyl oligopeptidase PreP (S9A serine peptidase family)